MTNAEKETPIGMVTIEDIHAMSPTGQEVVLEVLKAINQLPEDMAGHLLRRLFVRGESMKYDPGDEPPMKIGRILR